MVGNLHEWTADSEGTFRGGYYMDTTINGAIAALQNGTQASLSFEYGPEGTTSGRKKYSGECIITSYEVSSPVGDVVTFSLEAQNTGDVTVGTWA